MRRATILVSMAASVSGPLVLLGSCGTGGRLAPPAGDSAAPPLLSGAGTGAAGEALPSSAPSPVASSVEAGGEAGVDAGPEGGAIPDCRGAAVEGVIELPPASGGMMTNATADASVDLGYNELGGPIAQSRGRLLCCYAAARGRHADLEGTILLDFTLNADGSVKAAAPNFGRSDIKDPAMGACVAAVLTGLSFPPSRRGRGATVSLPIAFRPREAGAPPGAAR